MKIHTILYITYDGLLEPLGQSQVFQYLKALAADPRYRILLLSYEKPHDWNQIDRREEVRRRTRESGILWFPLRYHKRPTVPATAFDLLSGFVACLFLCLRYRVKIIHVRSYVPAILGLIFKKWPFRIPLIFDMRGFWADERVDGGMWRKNARIYRVAKWFEQRFLMRSDVIISLTETAVKIMKEFSYLKDRKLRFEVIPTCANLTVFQAQKDRVRQGFTLGYVGSMDHWYLFEPAVQTFLLLKAIRPEAKFLIINHGQHELILQKLREAGVSNADYELLAAPHQEMPAQISRMDATAFFIKPLYSKKASAPTKLGELLGCGVPCLTGPGVGDVDSILRSERVGALAKSFELVDLKAGLNELLALVDEPGISDRCVVAARKHFSLEKGVAGYRAVYNSLLGLDR